MRTSLLGSAAIVFMRKSVYGMLCVAKSPVIVVIKWNYINSLMQKQNENFKNYMESKHNKTIIMSTVSLQILLKNILKNSDYSLNIPIQYLNKKDIEAIIKYIQTGEIDIGNEKIYKYVSRPKTN